MKNQTQKLNLIKKIFWHLGELNAVILIALAMLFSAIKVRGHSMNNTYANGQNLWGLNYRLKNPLGNSYFGPALFQIKRNDVVVIQSKTFAQVEQMHHQAPNPLIKRVIGLPGEQVQVKNHAVLINKKPVKEYYQKGQRYYDNYTGQLQQHPRPAYLLKERMFRNTTFNEQDLDLQLSRQQIFAMGDNRNYSNDSRVYGPFNVKQEIQSKVFNWGISLTTVRIILFVSIIFCLGISFSLDHYLEKITQTKNS